MGSLGGNSLVDYSFSAAFDPIIKKVMTASAPALEEKNADAEGIASSLIETEAKPNLVVAFAKTSPKSLSKVSSFTLRP